MIWSCLEPLIVPTRLTERGIVLHCRNTYLSLGGNTDESLTVVSEGNGGRGGSLTYGKKKANG